jgi:hypothetical protein
MCLQQMLHSKSTVNKNVMLYCYVDRARLHVLRFTQYQSDDAQIGIDQERAGGARGCAVAQANNGRDA